MEEKQVARVAPAEWELASDNWLELLRGFSAAVHPNAETFELDLTRVTWIGHLPLLALCLGLQHIDQAQFAKRRARMPDSAKVRAFLHRWGFYDLLNQFHFEYDRGADSTTYSASQLATRVLPIRDFATTEEARDLRDRLRMADTDLRKVLRTASQLNDREIHGLADLVIYELCKNAAEHAVLKGKAFIFGRFSPPDDPARPVYVQHAAYWEKKVIAAMARKGITEIVLGDAGSGIVETLRDHARKKKTPAQILEWAFEPLSTRKHESRQHTRGLWAVKNKIRELRGVLYVRTGDGAGGGLSAVWDFFSDPTNDEPDIRHDDVPFSGTQFQILLPHRTDPEPKTTIEWHHPAIAESGRDLTPRGFAIPPTPPAALGLEDAIGEVKQDEVLFIDMSAMKNWDKKDVERIAQEIYDGIKDHHYARLWLLDPSNNVLGDLQASRWLQLLWEEQAILIPVVTRRKDKPPRVEYVISDVALIGDDPGDTPASRRALLYTIGVALSGETFDAARNELDAADEQTWLSHALNNNKALVASNGHVVAALDIESLSTKATEALLVPTIKKKLEERFNSQRGRNAVWYRLPSRRFCRYYIGPHIFDQLSPTMKTALEGRLERMIRQTGAQYAVAFTSSAQKDLARAARAGIPGLVVLERYVEAAALEELEKRIPNGSRAVLLVLISGSGRTIARLAKALTDRNVETTIVCAVDTTSDVDRAETAILGELAAAKRLRSIVQWPVPTVDELPTEGEEASLQTVVIDPETLLPLPPVDASGDLLSDGDFWTFIGESHALSAEPITYKGIDYTTLFWVRNLSKHPAVRRHVNRDLKTCFEKLPDIICLPEDTARAVTDEFIDKLDRAFPSSLVVRESELPYFEETSTANMKGKYVAIFAVAASSGSGVGRLLNYFETARGIHMSIFINRIPEGITAAFTRQRKVTVSTFKRIYSASPELRIGSSRSIAIRSLDDYRPSCLSNRLLLFVEALRSRYVERAKAAQSPDELPQIAQPIAEPESLKFDSTAYDFSTPVSRGNLEQLVTTCKPADARWLYAVLEEAASRAEATLHTIEPAQSLESLRRSGHPSRSQRTGHPPRSQRTPADASRKAAWRSQYVEWVEKLYATAPKHDTAAKTEILTALLLDRWEWHGHRSEHAAESDTFGEALLTDLLNPRTDTSFRALCIRTISKVHRQLLIRELEAVTNVAWKERETELTLALELTKILDDPDSAPALCEQFGRIYDKRRSDVRAGIESELDVALDSLLEDLGLRYGPDGVTFLPWEKVRAILEEEPPDHDRTMRSLIRAMRGRFGPNAGFLYYIEIAGRQFVYGDSFPRRAPTNTEPIPHANLKALELLGGGMSFYSELLRADRRPGVKAYLDKLDVESKKRIRPRGMALYVVRTRAGKGIFRVWQDVDKNGKMPDEAVNAMLNAIHNAKRLIDRGNASLGTTGVWQYQRTIETLQEHRGDTSAYDPLEDFTDRARSLLGGDLASVVVLDKNKQVWTRRWLVGRKPPSKPLSFPADQTTRLTVWVAKNLQARTFNTRAEAIDAGFVESLPARWAQAWIAFPLLRGEECNAVVHVWHHTPAWFEPYDQHLIRTLGNLGGGLADVATTYADARTSETIKVMHAGLKPIVSNLVNLSHIVEVLASDAAAVSDDRNSRTLARCARVIQDHVAAIPHLLDVDRAELALVDIEHVVRRAVTEAGGRYGADKFALVVEQPTGIEVDAMLVGRAIGELLRNARGHLTDGKVHVTLTAPQPNEASILIEILNDASKQDADDRLAIHESMGPGIALARAAAERHSGRFEESTESARPAFRLTLPSRGVGPETT
jgi:hypothetical protein